MEIRPCVVEVNLDSIVNNYENIKKYVNKKVIAVVKANAYGHGILDVSRALIYNGVDMLAVATVEEAMIIRDISHSVPILVLGPVLNPQKETCILNNISFIVSSIDEAITVSCLSKKLKKNALIHITLDTGMSRVGIYTYKEKHNALCEVLEILKLDNIEFQGISTHFATADEEDLNFMHEQYEYFKDIVLNLKEIGYSFPYVHCQNSAASINLKDDICNYARVGLALYGYYPSDYVKKDIDLKIALRWKCKITHIKIVKEGTPIGYGSTYVTKRKSKIATIPVGYADGFRRSLSNNFYVSYKGERAKVVGRVCMDQSMIDVTGLDCAMGDFVYLIDENYNADYMASIDNTISYETLCGISLRVPRIYEFEMKNSFAETFKKHISCKDISM